MIKLSTLFWLVAVATAGFAMFAVKYEVQTLADEFARTAKQADDTERDIRVLDAEWAYLNRPDALAQMNQRFLSLGPIATKQLRTSLADVAMRPAPPPPPAPVESVETVAGVDAPIAVAAAPTPEAAPAAAAVVPSQTAEGAAQPSGAPASARPAQSPRPVVTAALDTRLDTRVAASSARPAPVRAAPSTGACRAEGGPRSTRLIRADRGGRSLVMSTPPSNSTTTHAGRGISSLCPARRSSRTVRRGARSTVAGHGCSSSAWRLSWPLS